MGDVHRLTLEAEELGKASVQDSARHRAERASCYAYAELYATCLGKAKHRLSQN